MPENSWPDNDARNELELLNSLVSEGGDLAYKMPSEELDADEPETPEEMKQDGRRLKAAMVLSLIWTGVIALYAVSWGAWFVGGVTVLMGFHALRLMLTRPGTGTELSASETGAIATSITYPRVSLLVAAKNEEAVIGNLVQMMGQLDYPADRYDFWVINDNSSDRTGEVLDQLALQYPQLKVFHRQPGAGGGKSGALNQVLPLTKGDIIAVFDADAQVSPDLLQRVLPLFEQPQVGAVQVRKAIANQGTNFWTQGQAAEMALDTFFQQQRIALGGIGELRGNGQFVRRAALEDCGGWNEETITDDLDLTLRLHLSGWNIEFLAFPAVQEEGVTRAIALWHQRSRWAEGGYQRYLDYWRLLSKNRLGVGKSFDLVMFLITQYLLPTAAIPDTVMAIAKGRLPILAPMTSLTITLSLVGMFLGLRRIRAGQSKTDKLNPQTSLMTILGMALHTLQGTLYMLHWLPVMATTTFRMSIRPKRLKWVKTVHQGTDHP